MKKIIGKIIATEKCPSTMEDFYFWTQPDLILDPFDVVKVDHLNGSVTYGMIEAISHITDASSFLTDYISYDFGDVNVNPPTYRIGMNYVQARIIGNSRNIYTPVLSGQAVSTCDKQEIIMALGLNEVQHPIACGYLEMYKGAGDEAKVKIPVHMDARYLIGPEGAHLNISGISGLAAKTSYAMFLLKSIQDKCLDAEKKDMPEDDENVAFVIFNVKGNDLLAIDEKNPFESEGQKKEAYKIYDELGMTQSPFKNVHYYYPHSEIGQMNTYTDMKTIEKNIHAGKAHMYMYEYKKDKTSLDLMFSSIDDPSQTMDSILSYIASERGGFGRAADWEDFLEEVHACGETGNGGSHEISVLSWRKFERIVKKSISKNSAMFDSIRDASRDTRISEALSHIKKNEVHVIDIAKLDDDMQCFVFGDAIKALYDLQLGTDFDDDYVPPSKIVIFMDELNKYAGSDAPKSSPILRQVLDIAERGRSLGVVLFGAEQFKSNIHARVTGNCSTTAYGRTNSMELSKSDYRFIPNVYKNMMTRLSPGEYIINSPVFRSLLSIKFPRPIYRQPKS